MGDSLERHAVRELAEVEAVQSHLKEIQGIFIFKFRSSDTQHHLTSNYEEIVL